MRTWLDQYRHLNVVHVQLLESGGHAGGNGVRAWVERHQLGGAAVARNQQVVSRVHGDGDVEGGRGRRLSHGTRPVVGRGRRSDAIRLRRGHGFARGTLERIGFGLCLKELDFLRIEEPAN